MLLCAVISLYALLLYRLGMFAPLKAYYDALSFDEQVLQIAEDVEWEERMQIARQRKPVHFQMPRIHFRAKG